MSENRYLFILPQERGSVTLPRRLVFDKSLSAGAKLCYAVALALCQNSRWKLCHAGLATMLNASLRTVKRWTSELRAGGWLRIMSVRSETKMVIGWEWTLMRKPGEDAGMLVRRSDTILHLVRTCGR